MIRVLTDVDRAYWQLYAAREALKVRKKHYDSTQGAAPARPPAGEPSGSRPSPMSFAPSPGLADTVESIIVAENDVRQAQRKLKRILNDLSLPLDAPTTIMPTTPPAAFPYDLEPTRLTDTAMAQRMEMLDLELQLAEQTPPT